MAINEIRSRWRRRRVEKRVVERLSAEPRSSAPGPVVGDDALWRAVADLPERARRMVALRYVLDLSEAQIASELGVTRGTVASTLSRARQELSAVLTTLSAHEEL